MSDRHDASFNDYLAVDRDGTASQPDRQPPRMSRRWRFVRGLLLGLAIPVALLLGGGVWLLNELRLSRAQLEGERPLAGLQAPVEVARDALGVPEIAAGSRSDAAIALGFLHAQERYFQMDLARRRAAGELAALVGAAALPLDRDLRRLLLRRRAEQALTELPDSERRLLTAYTSGVNQGLEALDATPWEYLLLRQSPTPWSESDSVLVLLSMFVLLQDRGEYELLLGALHEQLPAPLAELLTPLGSSWDAALDGSRLPAPALPGPEAIDLRRTPASRLPTPETRGAAEAPLPGSNSFAVAGERAAAGGAALLANDMHLPLGVPNIWYRAAMSWPQGQRRRRVVGVTLPGTPTLVAGSNGELAWGFTNSEVDGSDVVLLEPVPGQDDAYLTPAGPRTLERTLEQLEVAHAEPQTLEVEWSLWGPVLGRDHAGRRWALAWSLAQPGAVNLELTRLEHAASVAEALELGPRAGIPQQNLLLADSAGHIGWTIAGRLPRRHGFDGRLPRSWADGSHAWKGLVEPRAHPRLLDPEAGVLWTANNRLVGGEALALLGDGGYALGARARQIRDRLLELEAVEPQQLLELQLDDRAVFLARWRQLLLEILDPETLEQRPPRATLRELVEGWSARASVDDPGYRLVRAFRLEVRNRALVPLLSLARGIDAGRELSRLNQSEQPLWQLVDERPAHLLDPAYEDWQQLLLSAADAVIAHFGDNGRPLAEASWGRRNTARIRHPLAAALPPWLAERLSMPADQLPGDLHMPRVQSPGFGASERMVVAPGREHEGLLHMPGSQSGHPLSPYFAAGHAAWVSGQPTTLEPGPPRWVLRLSPADPG